MGTKTRTIICLAAKRSGTTAIHQIFANHPDVRIAHPDQKVRNNEPNFWNFAADAILEQDKVTDDQPTMYQRFVDQVEIIAPDITVPDHLTEDVVFNLWDEIANGYAPAVFDKSPRYLETDAGLGLLLKYKDSGRDVRLFGIMRAPWDVVASQFELWEDVFPEGTPTFREEKWIEYYRRFESVQQQYGKDNAPLYYYEKVANDPQVYIPQLLEHCGLENLSETYAHFRPVSVGRYYRTRNPRIRQWHPNMELIAYARQHGYKMLSSAEESTIRRKMAFESIKKQGQRVYYKIKSMVTQLK